MKSVPQLNLEMAQILAQGLAAQGARHAVMSPGSRNTPLVLAFSQHPNITLHTILDERSAGFFALGLARVTGQITTLFCTSGSAGAHYLPAFIEAKASSIPLLAITADRPPDSQYSGDWQTIDQQKLFGTHARHFEDLGIPSPKNNRRAPQVIARAVDRALHPRGPVHLNAPFEKPLWDGLENPSEPLQTRVTPILRANASLGEDLINSLLPRLMKHPQGVISVGHGVPQNSEFRAAITELARILSWPILAEGASGLRFGPHDRSQILSSYDSFMRSESFQFKAKTVLRFGQTPCSKPLMAWHNRLAADALILVDPEARWHDPEHRASTVVACDPTALCLALNSALEAQSDRRWLNQWTELEKACQSQLREALSDNDVPLWEGPIASQICERLPENSLLHVANSMPIRDVDSFAEGRDQALQVFVNRGANGIDGTIATALGEATAWDDGAKVLVIGDLAFLHDIGSLMTAKTLGTSLTIVVINNSGGGIFGFLPIAKHSSCFE
ncbi:MAG: 2-succinyl-5-enolpyruvyl-6-hydroxy-3-cyclohexene-1-carboxylic-acid synthase, partial [Planctomycetota bacterium]|nr:2-succinyl-5-enolpyruvyl-6-hydroxy-3-cyclohexene-1-carboxylic-acid synthase [Planctomycetota bacterium]